MRTVFRRVARRARAVGLLFVAACFSDGGTLGPIPVSLSLDRLALVEVEGGRPRLVILDATTGARTVVDFTGTTDPVPGNDPQVPRPATNNILAMRPPSWRPDGKAVALSLVMANDQSEVVVVPLDGSGPPRVASVNTQNILSTVEWSPDGKTLYYVMSTFGPVSLTAVFSTDLTTHQVRPLTTPGTITATQIVLRASTNGSTLYIARATGGDEAPLFDYRSSVEALDLASGTRTPLTNVAGRIEAITRDGARVLTIARTAQLPDTRYQETLAWHGMSGGTPVTLASGILQHALLDDAEAVVTFQVDAGSVAGQPAYAYRAVPASPDGKTPDEQLAGTNGRTAFAAPFSRR